MRKRNGFLTERENKKLFCFWPAASSAMGTGVDWERAPRQTDGRCAVLRHRPTDPKRGHDRRGCILHGGAKDVRPRYSSVRRAWTTHPGRTHNRTVRFGNFENNQLTKFRTRLIAFLRLIREYEDLATGQLVLQDMVERLGIPVFNNIRSALDCTAKVYIFFPHRMTSAVA